MNKHLRIFFLLILFLGTEKTIGQILYTDLIPDSVASGLPQWRTDSVFIDVNQDGQNDFVMISSSWFYFVHQNCCPCYRNEIHGLAPLNKIAKDTAINWQTCGRIFLDSGLCVGANYQYENIAVFNSSGPCGFCVPAVTVSKYHPFHISLGGSICYGWFRILSMSTSMTLYDMALNLTPNACITTGQTATGISELPDQSEFTLFPNPTNGSFTIQFNKHLEKGKAQVINIIGEIIYERDINQTSLALR